MWRRFEGSSIYIREEDGEAWMPLQILKVRVWLLKYEGMTIAFLTKT
jgi:hypothetical protein